MEKATYEITGFIQNVSLLGQGQTKKYFDFQVQTGTGVVRAVATGSIKVILWELDVDQVEEGKTYFFRNL